MCISWWGHLYLALTIRCFHKRRKPDFDVWPGLWKCQAIPLWRKGIPSQRKTLPLPLAPAHFRPARWLQWRFYFSHSAPTPLPNLLPGTLPATNTFKSQLFMWLLQDRLLLKDTEGKRPRKPNPCKRCNYDGGLITLHVVLIIDMDEFCLRRSCGSQRGVECGGELDCSGKAVLGQPLDSSDK